MSDRISLPKDRIRVLLLEGISDSAVELFGRRRLRQRHPRCRRRWTARR